MKLTVKKPKSKKLNLYYGASSVSTQTINENGIINENDEIIWTTDYKKAEKTAKKLCKNKYDSPVVWKLNVNKWKEKNDIKFMNVKTYKTSNVQSQYLLVSYSENTQKNYDINDLIKKYEK